MTVSPAAETIEAQGVWPPYFSLSFADSGVVPRTPQKVISTMS
jgi:hypothetical protein